MILKKDCELGKYYEDNNSSSNKDETNEINQLKKGIISSINLSEKSN